MSQNFNSSFRKSLQYSHLVGVEGWVGGRPQHIRLMLHPELTWLSFFPQQSFAMDSAHSIPILPELEEANGGEASEEKASDDDQKATFLLASMMSCNQNISYFSVAVVSWAKCKAQNYANCRIMQHVKFAKCKIIVLQLCIFVEPFLDTNIFVHLFVGDKNNKNWKGVMKLIW